MPDSRFPFSNFERVPGGLTIDGVTYPTSEHAYQASKLPTNDPRREWIASAPNPGSAKRAGRQVSLPDGWDMQRRIAMWEILKLKFNQEPFKSRLQSWEGPLVEWNTWHDNYWGDCTCGRVACQAPGENMLGRMLTRIRHKLQQESGQ